MDTASADKAEGTSICSRIIGSGSGKKGKQLCRQCNFSFISWHILISCSIPASQGRQGSYRSNGEARM